MEALQVKTCSAFLFNSTLQKSQAYHHQPFNTCVYNSSENVYICHHNDKSHLP